MGRPGGQVWPRPRVPQGRGWWPLVPLLTGGPAGTGSSKAGLCPHPRPGVPRPCCLPAPEGTARAHQLRSPCAQPPWPRLSCPDSHTSPGPWSCLLPPCGPVAPSPRACADSPPTLGGAAPSLARARFFPHHQDRAERRIRDEQHRSVSRELPCGSRAQTRVPEHRKVGAVPYWEPALCGPCSKLGGEDVAAL